MMNKKRFTFERRSLSLVLLAFLLSSPLYAEDLATLTGTFKQGGMVRGQAEPGSIAWLDGEPLRVSKEGYFVFGFGRNDTKAVKLVIEDVKGNTKEELIEIETRKYDVQRIDGIDKKYVAPGKEVSARIKSDRSIVGKARAMRDKRTDFMQNFIWPVTGRISGVYGSQRILNGTPKWPHYGVDIARPTGTEVIAPADGVVTLAHDDMYYTGGTLIIDHGHGVSSTFIHLSKITVKKGERIKQGDKIAEVGATGRVTGPHLDWRINWKGKRLDPQLLVGPMPKAAVTSATQ